HRSRFPSSPAQESGTYGRGEGNRSTDVRKWDDLEVVQEYPISLTRTPLSETRRPGATGPCEDTPIPNLRRDISCLEPPYQQAPEQACEQNANLVPRG